MESIDITLTIRGGQRRAQMNAAEVGLPEYFKWSDEDRSVDVEFLGAIGPYAEALIAVGDMPRAVFCAEPDIPGTLLMKRMAFRGLVILARQGWDVIVSRAAGFDEPTSVVLRITQSFVLGQAYDKVAVRQAQKLADDEAEQRFGVHREFATVRAAIDELEGWHGVSAGKYSVAVSSALDALEERVLEVTRTAVARSST